MLAPEPEEQRPLLLGLRRLCRLARVARTPAPAAPTAPQGENLVTVLGRFLGGLLKPIRPAPWRADRRALLVGLVGALASSSALASPGLGPRQVLLGPHPAPVLQNVTVPMGQFTNLGTGSVLLRNLPGLQIGGAPAAFWRISGITAVGGGGANSDLTNTAATLTSAQSARTPAPSLGTGSNITLTLAATSYTMTVVAVSANGRQSLPATLTYSVVGGAFNRGDNTAGADTAARWQNIDIDMGGKTMLLSVGADFGATTAMSWNQVRAPSLCTVQNADNLRPARLCAIDVVDCTFLTFDGLIFRGAPGVNVIQVRFNSAGCNDINVKNCSMTANSRATVAATNQQNSAGIKIIGAVVNVTVENNALAWIGRCVEVSGMTSPTTIVRNNTFRYFFADGLFIGTSTGVRITGNILVSPMRYGGQAASDHLDWYQFADFATVTDCVIQFNLFLQADGNAGINTQAGQTSSVNLLFACNLITSRTSSMAEFGAATSATIRDNTFFAVGSGLIANNDGSSVPTAGNDNIYPLVPVVRAVGGVSGTVSRNFTTGSMTFGGGFTLTDNRALNVSYPNVTQYPLTYSQPFANENYPPNYNGDTFDFSPWLRDVGGSNGVDARERLDNLAQQANGTDWAKLTIAEVAARYLLILTPKTGGSLDLGGGATAGAVGLDGVLKAA